jgi:hypothetical protein
MKTIKVGERGPRDYGVRTCAGSSPALTLPCKPPASRRAGPWLAGYDLGEKLIHLGVQALVGAGAHLLDFDPLKILG